MSARSLHNTLQTQFLQTPRSVLAWICGRGWGSWRPSWNPAQQESTEETEAQKRLKNRSCFIGMSSYKDAPFLCTQRSQWRGIHSGTLRHVIIQWLLNLRVGFGKEGVLAHKTMTLHINVLYRGRGCEERCPMLVPRLSPLNKVSVESICPRGVSWAESEFAFPPLHHSPVFSAESAAFVREVDYWIMNYRSFSIFQPSSEMWPYFSTYWGSKWKEKEKILLSSRERKKKNKKKKKQPQSYLTAPSHSRGW